MMLGVPVEEGRIWERSSKVRRIGHMNGSICWPLDDTLVELRRAIYYYIFVGVLVRYQSRRLTGMDKSGFK